MKVIRRMIMIGTFAFAITINSGIWSNTASANLLITIDELESQRMLHKDRCDLEEDLHLVLGFDSEDEFIDAVHNHHSLAEIAEIQQVDVQNIIALLIKWT